MLDVVPDLLAQIQKSFNNQYMLNSKIAGLQSKIAKGTATYADAQEYAVEVGEMLATSLGRYISAETLPDGTMYHNIASRILNQTLGNNHELIASVSAEVQTSLNRQAGLGIKGIQPQLNQSRIDGLVNKISGTTDFSAVEWLLGEPVVNFSESIVDDSVKQNAEFAAKSGLTAIIKRTAEASACDWCRSLAGTYKYPEVPQEVFMRHRDCHCKVEYDPGDGRRQNVHSKKWVDPDQAEIIEERKKVGMPSEEDQYSPDRLMGLVSRGESMSISEADEHNANPFYLGVDDENRKRLEAYTSEIEQLRKEHQESREKWQSLPRGSPERKAGMAASNDFIPKINELQSEYLQYRQSTIGPYTKNCQRCAPTYELRRRGYDVTALPNYVENYYESYRVPAEMWRTADGSIAKPELLAASNNRAVTKKLIEQMEVGERGTIEWQWGKQNGGHIINVERTLDGILVIDAQVGIQSNSFEDYMQGSVFKKTFGGMKTGVKYNRTDDKFIDLNNIGLIVKGVGG